MTGPHVPHATRFPLTTPSHATLSTPPLQFGFTPPTLTIVSSTQLSRF